jgi:hypothetical protein
MFKPAVSERLFRPSIFRDSDAGSGAVTHRFDIAIPNRAALESLFTA